MNVPLLEWGRETWARSSRAAARAALRREHSEVPRNRRNKGGDPPRFSRGFFHGGGRSGGRDQLGRPRWLNPSQSGQDGRNPARVAEPAPLFVNYVRIFTHSLSVVTCSLSSEARKVIIPGWGANLLLHATCATDQ
eukprot:GFKZ01014348.1.p1 GENE.GFKZ01014348.1~~GFKZ01014348.1.p1  ORF type:complete len:136 (+),score=0.16 GFKZ01014348.1:510-917(+)